MFRKKPKKDQEDSASTKKTTSKYRKSELLQWWKESIAKQDKPRLASFMETLPYNFTDSRFGHDSIRIEGSKQFISHILVSLQELLEMENSTTRLELTMYRLDNAVIQGELNRLQEHYVLYVRALRRRPGILDTNSYSDYNYDGDNQ